MPKPHLAAAVLGAFALAPPAFAEGSCGKRDVIIAALQDQFGEQHLASGLSSATSMVEIWASESTGTWTVLMTDAGGQSCIAASGANWLAAPPLDASQPATY